MSDSDVFASMNDPDFLAEYRRVRETLEDLTDRYRLLQSEFDRRAGTRWKAACGVPGGATSRYGGSC